MEWGNYISKRSAFYSFCAIGVTFYIVGIVRNIILTRRRELERERRRRRKQIRLENMWNTVMFFPDYAPEKPDSTTHQLMWYMEQAKQTIDIAINRFNFKMIEEVLEEQSRQGVRVRLLTDGCKTRARRMRQAGIEIRSKIHTEFNELDPKRPADLMHHKFVIIDDKAIMTGSLNWTWDGIQLNFENMAVTTEPLFVAAYRKEFDRLWNESDKKKTYFKNLDGPCLC